MVQQQKGGPSVAPAQPPMYAQEPQTTGWVGWLYFAGVMMLILGSFNAINGFVAIFQDEYYLVRSSGLVIKADFTTWGWIMLTFGALVVLTGLGVIFGQTWARVVGVVLAALNALANLTFLAAYPVWSVLIITLDVLVIYALIVHGREMRTQ